MITATLYTTTDDNRKVNKSLTTIASVNLHPLKNVALLTPDFVIDYNAAYLSANYIYVATFGRYYYISDITVSTANTMILHCICDYLMSWKNYFADIPCVVTRNEFIKSTNVPDSKLPVDPVAVDLESLLFTGGTLLGVTSSFLLQTMGGSGS